MLYNIFELDCGHMKALMDNGFDKLSEKQQAKAYRKMLLQQRQDYLDEIEQHAQSGEWDKVCSIIQLRPFIMEEGFELYYDRIPDSMKYEFVTGLFTHNGDHCANIRKALTEVRKYGSPVLPDWMTGKDVITVYRGCGGSIKRVGEGISWSTNRKVAEFFANRCIVKRGVKGHVYEAKLRIEDIIAYTDNREEQEVMQFRKVFDIKEVPFEPGNIITMAATR